MLAAQSLLTLLLGLFAVSILKYVLRRGHVTADKIYAAICVYLLIGYAWAFAYSAMEQLNPGSFSASNEPIAMHVYAARSPQMGYFSFVTLTTCGYGDIIPRSQAARTFAVLEAVMGQMYLAILVARLVGLRIVHGIQTDRAMKTEALIIEGSYRFRRRSGNSIETCSRYLR